MLDKINALIDDDVTDVSVSAANGVWVQRDAGASRSELELSEHEVRQLAINLIDMGGRHIDEANPCVDVRLQDGVRVHAVLAPLSVGGTEISIRVPSLQILNLDDLLRAGVLTATQHSFLAQSVHDRQTIMVTGSAGAGKTTLLAALMSLVRPSERIISIEDVAELRISHPRHVSLETRQANSEGRGEISAAELIRQSLRMRPDRLIIGESRGREVLDMLRAFTTGHSGGGTTLHANSLEDVPVRLDSLGALAGMEPSALARLAHSAIDLIVHIDRLGSDRKLTIGRFELDGEWLAIREITLLDD